MKYLLILTLLLLGCSKSPAFKVGDCFSDAPNPKAEKWEMKKSIFTYKVLEIGKENYRTAYIPTDMSYYYKVHYSTQPFLFDRFNEKVQCPKELEKE